MICLVNSVSDRDPEVPASLCYCYFCYEQHIHTNCRPFVGVSSKQEQVKDALRCSGPHACYTEWVSGWRRARAWPDLLTCSCWGLTLAAFSLNEIYLVIVAIVPHWIPFSASNTPTFAPMNWRVRRDLQRAAWTTVLQNSWLKFRQTLHRLKKVIFSRLCL